MKKYIYFILTTILLIITSSGCITEKPLVPEKTEDFLYMLNVNSEIDIYSLNNPANPVYRQTVKIKDNINDINRKGNRMFLNTSDNIFMIYQINKNTFDSCEMTFKDSYGIPLNENRIVITNIVKKDGVVRLYDISSKEPKLLSEITLNVGISYIKFINYDNALFLMLGNYFYIMDTKNDKLVVRKEGTFTFTAYPEYGGIFGDYLFGFSIYSGTAVYDINNLTRGYKYLSEKQFPIYMSGNIYYTIKNKALQINELNDPYMVKVRKRIDLKIPDKENWKSNIFSYDNLNPYKFRNYLYYPMGNMGIMVVNTEQITNPVISFVSNNKVIINDIDRNGKYLYGANAHDGIKIIEISDKNLLFKKDIQTGFEIQTIYTDRERDLLYCGSTDNITYVFDIKDKENPIFVSNFYHSGEYEKYGNNILIKDRNFIYLIDMTDPKQPSVKRYFEKTPELYLNEIKSTVVGDTLVVLNPAYNNKTLICYDLKTDTNKEKVIKLPEDIQARNIIKTGEDSVLFADNLKAYKININTAEIRTYTHYEVHGEKNIPDNYILINQNNRLHYIYTDTNGKERVYTTNYLNNEFKPAGDFEINQAEKYTNSTRPAYLDDEIYINLTNYSGFNLYKIKDGVFTLSEKINKHYKNATGNIE